MKLLQSYSGLIYFSSQTQFLAWRDKQEYLYLFNTNHYWKRLWCWEGLGAGEGDDRGWDGWMASSTRWTWIWVNSRRWWWTGRLGVLRFMESQRVGHDWATELNWTELVLATHSRNQTHSEGQCRWWNAVYYTGGPKAESPLSQGPRAAFVKIFYTLCVRVLTTTPNSLRLTYTKENTIPITPSFTCYVLKQSNN